MRKITVSTAAFQRTRTLGAVIENGTTTFRVWAPERKRVELIVCVPVASPALESGNADTIREFHPLTRDTKGYWTGQWSHLAAGTLYKFRLDGRAEETFPDPASRYQP